MTTVRFVAVITASDPSGSLDSLEAARARLAGALEADADLACDVQVYGSAAAAARDEARDRKAFALEAEPPGGPGGYGALKTVGPR
jgi:hypothetical protein